MKRIIAIICILIMLFSASCSANGAKDGYMTVRTALGNDNFCYKTAVPAKDMKAIRKVLSSKDWVFDYNEELRINSKYKVYVGDESFYVAPDTDYVFLRVAEGETFEWRKAEKDSKIAKKAVELLAEMEEKYAPEKLPSDWVNRCLYDPGEDGQPKYFAAIEDADAKTLADTLDGLEYKVYPEDIGLELPTQYKLMLNRKQYRVTNDMDELIIIAENGAEYKQIEIATDTEEAKTINGILEKAVDIEPEFWREYSY